MAFAALFLKMSACELLNEIRDHGTLIPSSNPFWLSVRPSVRLTDGRCGFLVVSTLNFLFEGSISFVLILFYKYRFPLLINFCGVTSTSLH